VGKMKSGQKSGMYWIQGVPILAKGPEKTKQNKGGDGLKKESEKLKPRSAISTWFSHHNKNYEERGNAARKAGKNLEKKNTKTTDSISVQTGLGPDARQDDG